MNAHPYDRFREKVRPVLKSKLEEFKVMNYSHFTEQDLWNFLVSKKWRNYKEEIHLYEIISDIYAVKVSDLVTHATVQQLQAPDLFSEEGMDDLKELLGKKK